MVDIMNAKVEVLGDEKVVRSLRSIEKEVDDFTQPLELIAQHFFQVNKENMDREGSPKRFAQLSYDYKKWKNKNYPGKKIMQLTSRLYNALTAQNQTEAGDTIKDITKKSAVLGTDVPYDHRHHAGTFGMPERKIIQIQEKHMRVWDRIVHRWILHLFTTYDFDVYGEQFGGTL